MSIKLKVLHITPHLGGGVGRVVLNYLTKVKNDASFAHEVACLDYANEHAFEVAKNISLVLTDKMADKREELLSMVASADIVLIHWWNHPLLYDFLVRTQLPASRVIFWSHISGFHPPYVFTEKAFEYPDLFVFTTPVSFETKDVQYLSDELKKKLRVVWSTGGVDHAKDIIPRQHKGFNIGYIGTVDYCKMHPDFLSISGSVDIPDVKFIVCGGPKEKEMERESQRLGISEKFEFKGLVPDISGYLSLFDVFGYPLAPYHYGTCDQVLAESMAAGVVPVVLANKMESYMVKDGLTGIVAKDEKAYVNSLKELYHNGELRSFLRSNAIDYAYRTFSLDKMVTDWGKIFDEIISFPKREKKWIMNKSDETITSADIFLESLGRYGADFELYCKAENEEDKNKAILAVMKLADSPLWQAETRGTPHHYSSFFQSDDSLSIWSKLIRKGGENV